MIIKNKRVKGCQAYKEKGSNNYLIVSVDQPWSDQYGTILYSADSIENGVYLGMVNVSQGWLTEECYPVSYKKCDERTQKELIMWLNAQENYRN